MRKRKKEYSRNELMLDTRIVTQFRDILRTLNAPRKIRKKKKANFGMSVLHYTEYLQSKIQDQFRSPHSDTVYQTFKYNVNSKN